MEKIQFINAKLVKSNASRNMVWMITSEDWQPKFCKNAKSALRYIFMLKKSTGRYVSKKTLEDIRSHIPAAASTEEDKPSTIE